MNINVVGDLTGFFESFRALEEQMPYVQFWGLGDLVDRGPGSKQIIDRFIEKNYKSIMGNHDHMMIYNNLVYSAKGWIENGGNATAKSFGFSSTYDFDILKLDKKYVKFLTDMPLRKDIGQLIMTHAPMNDNKNAKLVDLSEIHKDLTLLGRSTLWNRLKPQKIQGKFQIYGHNSSAKGILWHTDKYPQGIYSTEVPEGAWGACIDTWHGGYLTGLHIDTELVGTNPQEAIMIFKQEITEKIEVSELV